MRSVLTTYNPVQLNFAQTLLKDAGIETLVLDGSLSCFEAMMWPAFRLMVLDDGDVDRAAVILGDGMKDWEVQDKTP